MRFASNAERRGLSGVMEIDIKISMIDRSMQTRAETNAETISEYAEAMRGGATFPPVTVFEVTPGYYVLADGFHRLVAVDQNGGSTITAEVHAGTRADALKHALKSNQNHGLRRTNADKRHAVKMALKEFGDMSNKVIAEMCGVSDMFVGGQRQVQTDCTSTHADGMKALPPIKRKGKDGKAYTVAPRSEGKGKAAEPDVNHSLATEVIADIKASQTSSIQEGDSQPETICFDTFEDEINKHICILNRRMRSGITLFPAFKKRLETIHRNHCREIDDIFKRQ